MLINGNARSRMPWHLENRKYVLLKKNVLLFFRNFKIVSVYILIKLDTFRFANMSSACVYINKDCSSMAYWRQNLYFFVLMFFLHFKFVSVCILINYIQLNLQTCLVFVYIAIKSVINNLFAIGPTVRCRPLAA